MGTRPLDTLQVVGRPRKAVPTVRVDLGFAEVLIDKGQLREIISKPPITPVEVTGKSTLKSQQEAEGADLAEPDEESVLVPTTGKTRVGLPSKVPPRKKRKPLTDYDYLTTLKGFDPYTGEGM